MKMFATKDTKNAKDLGSGAKPQKKPPINTIFLLIT
jgi:hypothetical protein